MANRQLGPGGPTYKYEGRNTLDAPHGTMSKLSVLSITATIGAHTANVVQTTTLSFAAGSFSNRAICLTAAAPLALEAGITFQAFVSAADTIKLMTLTNGTTNPADVAWDFVIMEP